MELKRPKRYIRARARILVPITIMVTILFILSSGLSYYFFNRSLNRLIEKSESKLIAERVRILSSGYDFLQSVILEIQRLSGITANLAQASQEFLKAIPKKEISPIQKIDNDILKSMTDDEFGEISLIIIGMSPIEGIAPEPIVILSSNEKLMYMKLPPDLVEIMKSGKQETHRYYKNGIPELGLSGEYLVSFTGASAATGISFTTFSFSSMSNEMKAINDFYNKARKNALLRIGIIQTISIIVLILISFVLLNLLIRRRITAPVDELAIAAESLMDGNLDVQVPVHGGEEFEGLKTAFNEMVKSLKHMLSKIKG